MAQQVKVLASKPEDPRTHMMGGENQLHILSSDPVLYNSFPGKT